MAAPATAHARLETTQPTAGETILSAPDTIRLTYSEPIEESFSGVQVFDPAGQRIDEGTPTIIGPDTAVPIGSMTVPGTYTVVFRVIGADGHPVESRYTLIFQPEVTAEPTPSAAPIPTPTAGSEPTSRAQTPLSRSESPRQTPSSIETQQPDVSDDGGQESVARLDSTDEIDPASFDLQDAGTGTDAGLLISRILDYAALVLLAGSIIGSG